MLRFTFPLRFYLLNRLYGEEVYLPWNATPWRTYKTHPKEWLYMDRALSAVVEMTPVEVARRSLSLCPAHLLHEIEDPVEALQCRRLESLRSQRQPQPQPKGQRQRAAKAEPKGQRQREAKAEPKGQRQRAAKAEPKGQRQREAKAKVEPKGEPKGKGRKKPLQQRAATVNVIARSAEKELRPNAIAAEGKRIREVEKKNKGGSKQNAGGHDSLSSSNSGDVEGNKSGGGLVNMSGSGRNESSVDGEATMSSKRPSPANRRRNSKSDTTETDEHLPPKTPTDASILDV